MSTASTSALSSVLSALNNGASGIDVTSAVASIIAADRAPEAVWQAEQTTLSSETSAIQQLESDSSSLTVSLQALGDPLGALSSVNASSSDTAAVTASAAPGASSGAHTVVVNNLATTGSWYSAEESSSSAALPQGSFQITSSSGASTTFTTGNGVNTLDQLAAAVNSAALGVTASVVNDENGSRLALVANTSGASADFSVSTSSGLTFSRAGNPAQDASLDVDGVPVSSASNTVAGAISGVTLTLTGTNTSATSATVTVSPDNSGIESAVNSFITNYNALVTGLNGQFTYSSSTSSEGVLSTDSTARSLQEDTLAAANYSSGSGSYQSLASLGITTNQDGTLSLNTAQLDQAVSSSYQSVVSFFQGNSTDAGFASNLISTLSNYTDPAQGAFTVDLQSIASENQDLTNQTNTFELYIATQQTLLTNEYNKANIALQQLPNQIKQVQALLGEDNSGSNS